MEIVDSYIVKNPGTPLAFISTKSWSYGKWMIEKGIPLRDCTQRGGYMGEELHIFLLQSGIPLFVFIVPRKILEQVGIPVPSKAYVLRTIKSHMDESGNIFDIPFTESDIVEYQTQVLEYLTSKGIHLS